MDEMGFGTEMCWFYSPVYRLETVPQQKALVRTRSPKVDNDNGMWYNEYSIFHIMFKLIFDNFDKLLGLRSRIPFSTLLESKNLVFIYSYSFMCVQYCIHDYFHNQMYYIIQFKISKFRKI